MTKDTLYFELLEGCAEAGCPVCYLSLKMTRRYLDGVMYENVNDVGVRNELRAARGYCNVHAWWLTENPGNSLGVAIIAHDLVNTLLRALEAAPVGRGVRQRARDLVRRLRPSRECPACAQRRTMEDHTLRVLLKYVADEELGEALVRAGGLCLPHFLRALELVRRADALTELVELQRRALGELRDDLAEFMRKSDHRFQQEGFGKEGDSWIRGVGSVAGERNVR